MLKKRETPGEGFPLALRAIHPSCALRTQKGVFRSLRRATKGAAFGNRHPLKRVDRNFIIWCGIKSMKNGRTQFAPTVGNFINVLKSAPQQMPSPTRRRGTAPAVDEVVEFYHCFKKFRSTAWCKIIEHRF